MDAAGTARPQERSIGDRSIRTAASKSEESGHGDLAALMMNCSRYADPSAVIVHEGDSMEINSQHVIDMADGPIRLFSIDGGHTAAITHHDLEIAEGALAEGGVIILDDCFAEEWPDVSTGLHRFFAMPRRVIPFATGGNKTLLTTPNAVENYKRALVDCGSTMAEREFMGQGVRLRLPSSGKSSHPSIRTMRVCAYELNAPTRKAPAAALIPR